MVHARQRVNRMCATRRGKSRVCVLVIVLLVAVMEQLDLALVKVVGMALVVLVVVSRYMDEQVLEEVTVVLRLMYLVHVVMLELRHRRNMDQC